MPHDVTMPQLGMTQDEGKIVSWLKAAGDAVAKGDALFEVETDKATMEVEAQAEGFLTAITAAEGDDVKVGAVIAQISKTADEKTPAPPEKPAPAAEPEGDALPQGRSVTMPQLGMTQDTGLLVAWLKTPGDVVAKGDILFEVETDKSTVEVEADIDGYLAATLANAGEEVPVGDPVAIISADKPSAPIARGVSDGISGSMPAQVPPVEQAAQEKQRAAPPKTPEITPVPAVTGGRILASPKARRIALQDGLDLALLVKAGHPQPYHVADLDTLRALSSKAPNAAANAAPAHRFVAEIDTDGLPAFADWAATAHDLQDTDGILAALAAASLSREGHVVIAITRHGTRRSFDVGQGRSLSGIAPTDDAPDLILRDLRGTAMRTVSAGSDVVPVLTLMPLGAGLSITLECSADQMDADTAITLLSNFAARMEQPLRLLL